MGDEFWPLRLARELDDAVLQLRFNEEEIAVMAFNSIGSDAAVKEHCDFLEAHKSPLAHQGTNFVLDACSKKGRSHLKNYYYKDRTGKLFCWFLSGIGVCSGSLFHG